MFEVLLTVSLVAGFVFDIIWRSYEQFFLGLTFCSLYCLYYYLHQGGHVFARLCLFVCLSVCLFVCLSVCEQDNSKSYGRSFLKFWGYVGNGTNYQWFNFGGDQAGILDFGSLWNFRYHCFQWGIRETAAKPKMVLPPSEQHCLGGVCGLSLLSSVVFLLLLPLCDEML